MAAMVLAPTSEWVAEHHLDITKPEHPVEVVLDRRRGVLHVNVEGVCLLRICRVKEFAVEEIGE